MNQLLTLGVTTLLLLIAAPSQAKKINQDRLENTLTIAIVRDSIISRVITAYKAGNYPKTVQLLRKFLNPRRVIATPIEKEGLICLAIAYQKVGEEFQATETIVRAISIFDNSPIELANFENTAGVIAYQQNKKEVANQHWKKARQLYLTNDFIHEWAKTTLYLAKNYRELGRIDESEQLLKELERATLKLDLSDSAIYEILPN